jgi:PST family polysaccharide transporter
MKTEAEHSRALDGAVAGGLAWTAGAKSATQLISWLAAIVAARLLSPSDFGLASMAGFFGNVTGVLAEFGIGAAALQMPELSEEAIEQLNTCSVVICSAGYGLAVLAAPLAAAFFKTEKLKMLVIVNCLALFASGFQSVPSALLQKRLDYRRLSMVEAVQALTMALFTVIFAWSGFAYWSLVAGNLGGRVVAAALTYWWMPVKFGLPRWSKVEAALRLGSHVAVSRISSTIYVLSDSMIVGRTLGDAALGAYQWALNVAMAPADKIGQLVMRVTGPLFARVQKDQELTRRYFRIVSEALSLSVFPLMFGLAVVAPEAVQVVLGPKWAGAEGPIRWLAAFMGLRTLGTLVTQVLTSLRYTRFNMWISLLSFVLMPAAFWVASRWGASAVAASWILLSPVTVLPLMVKALRAMKLPSSDYLGVLLPSLLGSTAMAAAVWGLKFWLEPADVRLPLRLALEIAAGGAAYGLFLLAFYRERLKRYARFVTALRGGNAAAALSV